MSDLVSAFRTVVDRYPNRLALSDARIELTYAELWDRGLAVAQAVRRADDPDELRIGVLLDRSVDLIVAIVGTILAGAAYVPLAKALPKARLGTMIATAGVSRILGKSEDDASWGTQLDVELVALNLRQSCAKRTQPQVRRIDQLACVLFTSGSTGSPKAVGIEDAGVLNLCLDPPYVPLEVEFVVGQIANPLFDAFTFELWGALLNGCTLCVVDTDILPRIGPQLRRVAGVRPTTLLITTALFNRLCGHIPRSLCGIDYVLFGGEQGTAASVVKLLNAGFRGQLVNLYGPTEATTVSTWWPVDLTKLGPGEGNLPIGFPIPGMEVILLDDHGQGVPNGEVGELYLAGKSLARGYLGATAGAGNSFLCLPDHGDRRFYRSGDLAFKRPDGALQYAGRKDEQVKIRGHRIEPGEVSACLLECKYIAEAAVLPLTGRDNELQLCAYLVPQKEELVSASLITLVRKHLDERLPAYMIPHKFLVTQSLPLTANGKVDRSSLHQLEID